MNPKTLLYLFLLSGFFYACGGDTQNSKPESNNTNTTTEEDAKLTELPKIAVYVNEIGLPNEEMGSGENLKIILKDGNLTLENEDESSIRYQAKNNGVKWSEGFTGTGIIEDLFQSYYLIEDGNEPVVLVLDGHNTEERYGSVYREDAYHNAKDVAEAYGEELGDEHEEVGELMTDRDYTLYSYNANGCTYSLYKIKLAVYQKKAGQWKNLGRVLPTDFVNLCKQYYPINKIATADDFINLNTDYTGKFVEANKSIFDTWCDLEPRVNGRKIEIGCKDNPMFVLNWDGQKYIYEKSPSPTIPPFKLLSCENLDLSGNTVHTFKGKIGADNAIEMKLKFQEVDRKNGIPKVKVTGDYAYTKGSGRMDIEGEFMLNLGEAITFYRMKDGKKQEAFDCFFTDCQMKG